MPQDALSRNSGIGSWIERRARVSPDRVALIAGDRSTTYADLAARIRRLAGGFRSIGVRRGDRVAWLGPNHPAFLESLFAAGLLGAAVAPVNHRLDGERIASILHALEPRLLLQHREVAGAPVPGSVEDRIAVAGPVGRFPELDDLVAASSEDAIDEQVGFDDLCLISHTSGTTGSPKGVMLTHGNVTWNVVNFLTCTDFRSDDVTVAIAPFFRVGGTGVNVLPVLFMGGTVVVPEDASPDGILETMERHRVTIGFGNPDSLEALAASERWPTADLSSLRLVLTGGAAVPERLIRRYLDRGLLLLQGYGLSEAAGVVLLLDPERALRKVGSAGRPPLLVDVRIVDPDGTPTPQGQTGELLARGPNVMAGYWRRPEETAAVLVEGGWLRTGDAARLDEEGDYWIVDRVADRFSVGGHAVYPGDVERALAAHPAVAEAGAVGIPIPDGGLATAAVVALTGGAEVSAEELRAHCRERLQPHQVPVTITFADRLPRSTVGKLIRSQLRALASAGGR